MERRLKRQNHDRIFGSGTEGSEPFLFNGEYVLIPSRSGQPFVGKTGYTQRQLEAIRSMIEVKMNSKSLEREAVGRTVLSGLTV